MTVLMTNRLMTSQPVAEVYNTVNDNASILRSRRAYLSFRPKPKPKANLYIHICITKTKSGLSLKAKPKSKPKPV